jgi:hypothetical protein
MYWAQNIVQFSSTNIRPTAKRLANYVRAPPGMRAEEDTNVDVKCPSAILV